MQRVKTSAIKCAVLISATVVGLLVVLSAQSVAQETNLPTLPPVESIGPKTNIRAFLLPDVPQVIHVAAVRRAWRMDPAIRDFRGMAENDWDFTVAGGVLGFGELDPDFNAVLMAEQMLSPPRLTTAEQIGSIIRRASITRAGSWSELFSFVRK